MSRPGYRKPDLERRSAKVEVRLTAEEKRTLANRADTAGLTLSHFIRRAALEGRPPRPRPGRIRAEAIRELNRLGVNLNQLVKLAHIGQIDPQLTDVLIQTCLYLEGVLKDVVEG